MVFFYSSLLQSYLNVLGLDTLLTLTRILAIRSSTISSLFFILSIQNFYNTILFLLKLSYTSLVLSSFFLVIFFLYSDGFMCLVLEHTNYFFDMFCCQTHLLYFLFYLLCSLVLWFLTKAFSEFSQNFSFFVETILYCFLQFNERFSTWNLNQGGSELLGTLGSSLVLFVQVSLLLLHSWWMRFVCASILPLRLHNCQCLHDYGLGNNYEFFVSECTIAPEANKN